MWRARRNLNPSKLCLAVHGVPVHPLSCTLCEFYIEDRDHALFSCPYAQSIWKAVLNWCGISAPLPTEILDLSSHRLLKMVNIKERLLFEAILSCTAWAIWKARNTIVMAGKKWNGLCVSSNIQIFTHLWFSSISNKRKLLWTNSFLNPSCP